MDHRNTPSRRVYRGSSGTHRREIRRVRRSGDGVPPKSPADRAAFFDVFWGDGPGLAIVQLLPCPVCAPKLRPGARLETFSWPEEREAMEEYIAAHQDLGQLHFGVLLRDPGSRNPRLREACLPGGVAWADVDRESTLEEIDEALDGVVAGVIASGGPGKHHVYVPLAHPVEVDEIHHLNRGLVHRLEADAGPASPHSLLGIPGTLNHKYCESEGEPAAVTEVRSLWECDRVAPDDVVALNSCPWPPTDVASSAETLREENRGESRGPLTYEELPDYVKAVLDEEPWDKRGSQAFHAGAVLMEWGATDEEIHQLVPQIRAVKEKYDGRVTREVERLIHKLRPRHRHAGTNCLESGCIDTPEWMFSRTELLALPAPESLHEFMSGQEDRGWLVEGLLPHPTYGQIAGPSKSFKTLHGLDLAFAVATGTEFLDRPVGTSGPVLLYINEGSKQELRTRIEKLRRARKLDDLPSNVHVRYYTAHRGANELLLRLRCDVARLRPRLVVLDPMYAFFDGDVDATNLMRVGPHLHRFSDVAMKSGASLFFVNHFRKNGSKTPHLTDITQSGSAEWCDAWILQSVTSHDGRDANLVVKVGGRGVGEQRLLVQLRNALDADPESDLRWLVNTPTTDYEDAVLDLLSDGEAMTKTEIRSEITGGHAKIDNAIRLLLDAGKILRTTKGYRVA